MSPLLKQLRVRVRHEVRILGPVSNLGLVHK